MRRSIIVATFAALLVLAMAATASAHVHGITPLLCPGIGNANSGGNATNSTPASATNGGPIGGLIPATTGNAPLTPFDGQGFQPPNNPHCAT